MKPTTKQDPEQEWQSKIDAIDDPDLIRSICSMCEDKLSEIENSDEGSSDEPTPKKSNYKYAEDTDQDMM